MLGLIGSGDTHLSLLENHLHLAHAKLGTVFTPFNGLPLFFFFLTILVDLKEMKKNIFARKDFFTAQF
jgi:hypothetical protein